MAVLLALGVAHVFMTLFGVVPGRLSIDEEIHHWMARSFAEDRSLALWNGYDESPSRELEYHFLIKPCNGKLYPLYPYLFPVITGPLYEIMGLRGFYAVNSFAFALAVLLCFITARRLFSDVGLALDSCLILVLATFGWEYSHAIWPHATAMLFMTGSVWAAALALTVESAWKARLSALTAGLIAGFGCGIRIDTVLVLPALVLPFLFMRPWRPAEAMMVLVGAVPGLAILAMTNWTKFGVLSPLSYGAAIPPMPKEIGLGAAAILIVLWLLTRARVAAVVQRRRIALWAVAAVICGGLLLVSETRELIGRILSYAYVSVVDFRALDAATKFSAMWRTPSGGVVYVGSLKKAVLQNMPYLPLLFVPALALWRNGRDATKLWLLFLVPITVLGYMSYEFPNHEGAGLTFNYRYFVSALPCMAILCAFALSRLKTLWPVRLSVSTAALVSALTIGAYLFLLMRPGGVAIDHEFPLLVLPLILAAMLAVLLSASLAFESFRTRALQTAGRIVLSAALVWAGLTAFLYDYARHREIRRGDYEVGMMIMEKVPEDSLFFVSPMFTPFSMVLERKRVRLAMPRLDGFRDFPRLVEFNLSAGRRVFAFFNTTVWVMLAADLLSQYDIRPVLPIEEGFVGEITVKSDSAATSR